MPRPTRAAASKAGNYADKDPSDDEDAVLGNEDASNGSSSARGGHAQALEDDEDAWSQGTDAHPSDPRALNEDSDAPVVKKARTSTTGTKGKATVKAKGKSRGRAGKLSAFLAMPLDVLVEIARYLDPITLLHMSRANKLMHGIFASRSATSIWSIVKANVYLPKLESTDLTDMQLASLIWERNCHICGRGRSVIVDYALRRRWCKTCQRANLHTTSRLRGLVENMHADTLGCSLFTYHSLSGYNSYRKPYYCLRDVQETSDRLHELSAQLGTAPRKTLRVKQSKETVQEEGVEQDEAERALARFRAFVQERRAIAAAAQKDNAELVKWERSSAASRKEADEAARTERKRAVEQKLLAMGYTEADCKFGYYSAVSNLVSQPTRLTDTIWARIAPKVVEEVERQKTPRLARELSSRMVARRLALEPRYRALLLQAQDGEAFETFPSYSIICGLPSVEPLWVPDDADLADEEWDASLPAILDEITTARRVITIAYAPSVVDSLADTDAPLDAGLSDKLNAPAEPIKPTAVLLESIGESLLYNDLGTSIDLGDTADSVTDEELRAVFSHLVAIFPTPGAVPYHGFPTAYSRVRHSTSLRSFKVPRQSKALVRQMLDVLKRAGIPNDITSWSSLEALGPMFKCHGCEDAEIRMWYTRAPSKSESLLWSEMIYHVHKYHTSSYAGEGSRCPEIRLMTSTYAADPPKVTKFAEDPYPEYLI